VSVINLKDLEKDVSRIVEVPSWHWSGEAEESHDNRTRTVTVLFEVLKVNAPSPVKSAKKSETTFPSSYSRYQQKTRIAEGVQALAVCPAVKEDFEDEDVYGALVEWH
jgi:hypothetical protein